MNFNISFEELSGYIENRYRKSVSFSRISEKELCASYRQHIIFKTLQIPVNITFDEVKADSILITYNGGLGIDMIITGALSFLKTKMPELSDILVSKGGHQLSIELSRIDRTKALVDNFRLKGITLHEDSIEIETGLR